MRYVLMKDVKPGMVLAQRLVEASGRILAGENSALTEYAVERIKREGYDGIYIQDELSSDIVIEGAISSTLRAASMGCIQKQDFDGCMRMADEIVSQLQRKSRTTLDFSDFRTTQDYIFAHSVGVAVLSCVVGMGFGLSEGELRNLTFAGMIHDIGKMEIPPIVRNKAGRLTRDEYQIMKSHAILSYELIKDRSDISAHVKKAVRAHHENVDGSGYPDGTLGEEQSLFTKILHVADVYDALISRSPYKKPYSPQEASEYLMGGCGVLFDKEVVEMLLKNVPIYPKGTEVMFSDGRSGIIYENSGVNNLRPIVKLYDGTMLDLSEPENFNMTITVDKEMAISEEYEKERKVMMSEAPARHRILVVDDMKSNLQMIQEILGDDYDLILAKNGAQALAYMDKKTEPDLILMDIDMPGMDGIETSMRIREKTTKRIPLIFVTSLCDRETVMKCRLLSPESYIVRPYKPVYVKTEIKRILENWSN